MNKVNRLKNELDRSQHSKIPENYLITPKWVNKISSQCLVCFCNLSQEEGLCFVQGPA